MTYDARVRNFRRTHLSNLTKANAAVDGSQKQSAQSRSKMEKLEYEITQLELQSDGSEDQKKLLQKRQKKLDNTILQVAEAKVISLRPISFPTNFQSKTSLYSL